LKQLERGIQQQLPRHGLLVLPERRHAATLRDCS
jgi:hypothetical protein